MTSSPPSRFAGRHAVVTGASQGIGRAVAAALAAEGARVSAIARRRELLQTFIEEIGGAAGGHGYVAVDLTEARAPEAALAAVTQRAGPPEIVVHAVGGSLGVGELTAPPGEWQRVWELNVGQAIAVNNLVLPSMEARGWGRILHFSSRAAVELRSRAPYSAAKAYLNAYVNMLGHAYAAKGVLVNAIMPSAIAAGGNNWARAISEKPDDVRHFLAEHQAINRLGTPQDLLPFILLLVSDDNQFAAGSVLSIDGGSQ